MTAFCTSVNGALPNPRVGLGCVKAINSELNGATQTSETDTIQKK